MSQLSRIYDVLKDGRPHTVAEIHRRAGTSRLNSRISDLRRGGYRIECGTVKGADTNTERYFYRLVSSAGVFGGAVDAAGAPPTTRSADSSSGNNTPAGTFPRPPVSATPTDYGEPPDRQGPVPHSAAPAGQLAFEVAA